MLVPVIDHSWDLSPEQAIALQRDLALRVEPSGSPTQVTSVAGIDVGIRGEVARAVVVVLRLPDLSTVECARAERPVSFPYVPGLLSFREAPVILDALARLQSEPDLLILDGQGYAHPRRMGIATHVGLLLQRPTVGCAKSRLCGAYEEPSPEKGSYTWLTDGDEIIGVVLRTRSQVRPVFVSVGHGIDLQNAMNWVLRCTTRYRLPEPTRRAHSLATTP